MCLAGWQAGDASTAPRLGALAAGQEESEAKVYTFLKAAGGRAHCWGFPNPGSLCLCVTQLKCILLYMPGACPISRGRSGCMELAQTITKSTLMLAYGPCAC